MYNAYAALIEELQMERDLEMMREEEREDGREEERKRIVANMLEEKLPLPLIARVTSLTESEIITIADSLGLAVM